MRDEAHNSACGSGWQPTCQPYGREGASTEQHRAKFDGFNALLRIFQPRRGTWHVHVHRPHHGCIDLGANLSMDLGTDVGTVLLIWAGTSAQISAWTSSQTSSRLHRTGPDLSTDLGMDPSTDLGTIPSTRAQTSAWTQAQTSARVHRRRHGPRRGPQH